MLPVVFKLRAIFPHEKNTKIALRVKGQNQMSPNFNHLYRVHGNTQWRQVVSISDGHCCCS